MNLDLRPHVIKCPDCAFTAPTFALLIVHWRKAWRSPQRFGKHWTPSQNRGESL